MSTRRWVIHTNPLGLQTAPRSLTGPGMPGVIEGGEGGAIIMLYFSTYSLWRMQQHVWRRFCNATATVHGGPVDFLFPLQSVPHEELGCLLVSESIEHLLLVFAVFTAAHHVMLVGQKEQITTHVCCTFYSS